MQSNHFVNFITEIIQCSFKVLGHSFTKYPTKNLNAKSFLYLYSLSSFSRFAATIKRQLLLSKEVLRLANYLLANHM